MNGLDAVTKRLPSLQSTQQKYISASVETLGQLEQEVDRIARLSREQVYYNNTTA